jgi:hypothetical protein
MFSKMLENPSHLHYCAGVLLLVGAVQFTLVRIIPSNATAGCTVAGAAVMTYFVRVHQTSVAVLSSVFLFLWGVRLAVKGIPVTRADVLQRSGCETSFSETLWIWLLCAPTVFATTMDARDMNGAPPYVGSFICTIVLVVDVFEGSEVDGKFCRNPYAFSSVFMSWGLFMMHPFYLTSPCPLLFCAIVLLAPGGTLWLEGQRRRSVMGSMEALAYQRSTSPFFPLPPGVYERVPRVLRQFLLCG